MRWFRCLLRGEEFPGVIVGEDEPIGFFVTRFVEAANVPAAERLVIKLFWRDPCLAGLKSDPTKGQLFLEDIVEIPYHDVPAVAPGFTFFKMRDGA